MMRIIDLFARFFVGALFIFSGLIKLNDPIGTRIKLEEYFDVFSVDFASFFEYLIPFALPLGMVLIILEVVLGVALLFNYRMKITTWILLLLILFFTFLTFYSAYFDKVTDCGCFGDAIPLTPWQSFTKDVILVVFIGHLFWYRHRFVPALRTRGGHIVIMTTTLLCLIAGIYAIEHLPYIDFRPYKIGNSIPEEMIPEETPVFEYVFQKEGKEVRSATFLSKEDGYEYDTILVTNLDKTVPKIQDYMVISPSGEDLTQHSFTGLKLFLIFQETKTLRYKHLDQLGELINDLEGRMEVMILTSIAAETMDPIVSEHQLTAPYYFVDGTVLKAMVRSNPGIMLVQDGIVKGKWHINDLPDSGDLAAVL